MRNMIACVLYFALCTSSYAAAINPANYHIIGSICLWEDGSDLLVYAPEGDTYTNSFGCTSDAWSLQMNTPNAQRQYSLILSALMAGKEVRFKSVQCEGSYTRINGVEIKR